MLIYFNIFSFTIMFMFKGFFTGCLLSEVGSLHLCSCLRGIFEKLWGECDLIHVLGKKM